MGWSIPQQRMKYCSAGAPTQDGREDVSVCGNKWLVGDGSVAFQRHLQHRTCIETEERSYPHGGEPFACLALHNEPPRRVLRYFPLFCRLGITCPSSFTPIKVCPTPFALLPVMSAHNNADTAIGFSEEIFMAKLDGILVQGS